MQKFISLIICLLCCCKLAAQETVFIGSYNKNKEQEGIYVYSLDTLSGKLKKQSSINIHNPSFINTSSDGRFLYACTETLTPQAGSVCAFAFDKEKKKLSPLNSQPSSGENPVYLTAHKSGKWLVNGNYTEGGVSVYSLGTDGSIGPARQVINFIDSSINKERQERAHIHATIFSPEQDYLFLPDLGADKIRCFTFDATSKQPLQQAENEFIRVKPGAGPRHMVFSPNGAYAYCIEEISGCIDVYRYINNKLEIIQHIAAHKPSAKKEYSSADIHLSPDGKFLYASNRGNENNIAIFSVSEITGKLKSLGYQSTLGNHPRMFAIDPKGKFLVVANQISGNVVVFRRNRKTGSLQTTGIKIKIPGASCVQIRDFSY